MGITTTHKIGKFKDELISVKIYHDGYTEINKTQFIKNSKVTVLSGKKVIGKGIVKSSNVTTHGKRCKFIINSKYIDIFNLSFKKEINKQGKRTEFMLDMKVGAFYEVFQNRHGFTYLCSI